MVIIAVHCTMYFAYDHRLGLPIIGNF